MAEDRIVALEIALRYVIGTARLQGVDIDDLCRMTTEVIKGDEALKLSRAGLLKEAINEIENAKESFPSFRRK
ncbi:MAG: hypothetical protein ACRES5_02760 [Pseudomonas sp.]